MPHHAHFPLGQKLAAVRWCPSRGGDLLAVASAGEQEESVSLYAAEGVEEGRGPARVARHSHAGAVAALEVARDGSGGAALLTAGRGGTVACLALQERRGGPALEQRRSWRFQASCLTSLAVAPRGPALSRVACAAESGAIDLFCAQADDPLSTLREATAVNALQFHPAEEYLLSASSGGQVRLWDLAAGRRALSLAGGGGAAHSLALHPARPFVVAAGTEEGLVQLWDVRSPGALLCSLQEHRANVWQLAFHARYPDYLFSCGEDGAMLLWNFNRHSAVAEEECRYSVADTSIHMLPSYSTMAINGFDLSDDGRSLAYVSDNECLHLVGGLFGDQ